MVRGATETLLAVALVACCCSMLQVAHAAVHPYGGEYFYSVGDAFIFRGGREGMFESKSEVGDPPKHAPPQVSSTLRTGGALACSAAGRRSPGALPE
jgi:hypothetical protein